MPFDVEQFFESPTVEALMDLRKTDLIKVAEKIEFSVRRGSFKFQIRNELIKYMVDDGLLEDSALEYVENDSDMVRIKELELQNEYRMRELEVRQRENECRMRELDIEREIKSKELELRGASPAAVPFNITANAKLVPPFQENAVDNYFRYFEKIAISSDWPKEQWTVLLQSILTGKAQEIYMSMSVTDSRDYDKVKTAVLKGYELVPEAYRLKFRNLRKRDNQSFLEFAREKDGLLARWCESEKVDNDCDKLYQLILVEEFKKCLPDRIKMYLNENRVKVLDEAARMAEDYALIHRNVEGPKSTVKPQPTPLTGKNEFKGDKRETASPGHNSSYDKKKSVRCFNCKLLGHTISNCWFLKEKKSKDVPVALASTRFKDVKSPVEVNLLSDTDRFRNVSDEFKPFCSEGSVSLVGDESGEKPIVILRDTTALQSLLLEGVLPLAGKTSDASVVIAGIECGHLIAPLHKVHLKSHFCDKEVTVGVVPKLPIEGVSFILANDLAGEKVFAKPQINVAILSTPDINDGEQLAEEDVVMFPACAVTRSMREARRVGHDPPTVARASQCVRNKDKVCGNGNDVRGDERTSLLCHETDAGDDKLSVFPVDKGKLIDQQKCDAELCKIAELAGSETDASDIPAAYYKKGGVLMRKWRPRHVGAGDEWHVVHQVVVPAPYRSQILSLAHDSPLSGHMGINKTCRKIMNHFYWPGLRRDVVNYCKSCHQCQVVGKPNQKIPVAPLYPIPVISEPFSHVIIDCVGPLPKTKSGNNYLLTIMCSSTRYPEAIPLRKISSKAIIKELTKFFCTYGLPRVIQSDQGSNFLSKAFQAAMRRMGVRHQVSSAYHPESQGALERFHQTLKNMVRIYCHETDDQWDEMVPLLLFAARECVQDTLGFSPFELVFGHEVRGPLKMLKERWLDDDNRSDILNHVMDFRLKLHRVCELARANLGEAQRRMKTRYDRDAQSRSFSPGERVLVFLPVPGQSLKARYFGPCTVEKNDNWVEHLERLQALFERLSAANLTVNLAKSDFAHAHVTYLGYEVGQGQVKPLNSKIHAIDKYPAPKAKREVMRFLGMAGYYRRFVMNFSDIVAPLTDLLKKGVKFIWSDSCEKAFKTVKAMLISSPILISPDFEKGFILYVDASDTGAGAVLCQADAAGVDHPVCYFSKKFNKHQRNYSTVEKETLALILALRHFEIYLYPTKEAVKIYTDHNPLTFISKMSCKNQRILRWSLELQKYNLSVNHIRGKENVLADALSRG
ncbi:uncharacterized protein [Penaeus vannamei]|uniref:uncharacterized protein n=1 Tax=Penaeus vannamei TaxID=6689 RepID=UPI00387F4609